MRTDPSISHDDGPGSHYRTFAAVPKKHKLRDSLDVFKEPAGTMDAKVEFGKLDIPIDAYGPGPVSSRNELGPIKKNINKLAKDMHKGAFEDSLDLLDNKVYSKVQVQFTKHSDRRKRDLLVGGVSKDNRLRHSMSSARDNLSSPQGKWF